MDKTYLRGHVEYTDTELEVLRKELKNHKGRIIDLAKRLSPNMFRSVPAIANKLHYLRLEANMPIRHYEKRTPDIEAIRKEEGIEEPVITRVAEPATHAEALLEEQRMEVVNEVPKGHMSLRFFTEFIYEGTPKRVVYCGDHVKIYF